MRQLVKNWNAGMIKYWNKLFSIIPFHYSILTVFLAISSAAIGQTLKDGIRLTVDEQYEEAAGVFKALTQKEPANATNYYYFGENYIKQEDLDSARIIFQKG